MTRSQKLLLPLALVAGAAVPALAVADDDARERAGADCPRVLDRSVTITPSLAEVESADPLREAAVLELAASAPVADLRVKLRQDVVRGAGEDGRRGRGRGRRAGVRVVEVAEGEYRVTVAKPQGGDVAFTTDRVRSQPGKLSLRLRAAVADAEGAPVRSLRATVHVRALQDACAEGDETGTTTEGTTTVEDGTTTTDESAVRSVRDGAEREDGRRGRGRGPGRA